MFIVRISIFLGVPMKTLHYFYLILLLDHTLFKSEFFLDLGSISTYFIFIIRVRNSCLIDLMIATCTEGTAVIYFIGKVFFKSVHNFLDFCICQTANSLFLVHAYFVISAYFYYVN